MNILWLMALSYGCSFLAMTSAQGFLFPLTVHLLVGGSDG
jgi:hypothetical protein